MKSLLFLSFFPALLFLVVTAHSDASPLPPVRPPEHNVLVDTIDFAERFAFSDDREADLSLLIPGTEDWYQYHCLHAQHTGNMSEAERILTEWRKERGETGNWRVMRNRQALLAYGDDADETLTYLKRRLHIRFDHQPPPAPGDTSRRITDHSDWFRRPVTDLIEEAVNRHPDFRDLTDDGLRLINPESLQGSPLRSYLERLRRPDAVNLARLVVRDLSWKNSRGFGSLPVHSLMTLAQLDECIRLMPRLRDDPRMVQIRLARQAPSDALNPEDPDVRLAWLLRLKSEADPLSNAFVSLKVRVLYHLLEAHRMRGEYPESLFLEYLSQPRSVHYMERKFLTKFRHLADPGFPADQAAGLLPPGPEEEEELVRDYLRHFFLAKPSIRQFQSYIRKDWLLDQLAETLLLSGRSLSEGPAELSGALSPEERRRLSESVFLRFAPDNPDFLAPEAPASIKLRVKNVPDLLIRIYEINAPAWYRRHKRPVDSSLDLDGLGATREEKITSDLPPIREREITVDLPELKDRPGVFVVECIGGGRAARAVLRKGRLFAVSRVTSAGHLVTVMDDAGQPRPHAEAWLDGRRFAADDEGLIHIPFSSRPDRTDSLVLVDGDQADLADFVHMSERIQFKAGMHLSAQSLIRGETATILIRPSVTVNSKSADIGLLEKARLTLESTDADGIRSSRVIHDFPLHNDRMSLHEFRVPENLSGLRVRLSGEMESMIHPEPASLSDETVFTVNTAMARPCFREMHLVQGNNGYAVEVRDTDGTLQPRIPVQVEVQYRWLNTIQIRACATDENGRIFLGPLTGSLRIRARMAPDSGNPMIDRTWFPSGDRIRRRSDLHILQGSELRLPLPLLQPEEERLCALLEKRGGQYWADLSDRLPLSSAKESGYLVLSDLSPGRYELYLPDTGPQIHTARRSERPIRIFVAPAPGDERAPAPTDSPLPVVALPELILEDDAATPPLHIPEIRVDGDTLRIRVDGADADTRVLVQGLRFFPAASVRPQPDGGEPVSMVDALSVIPEQDRVFLHIDQPRCDYIGMRDIGDEYRYILDRRQKPVFNGVMTDRPSLLIHPRKVADTRTSVQTAMAGDAVPEAKSRRGRRADKALDRRDRMADGFFSAPIYDFLALPGVVTADLTPDENGWIEMPLSRFGDSRIIHAAAFRGADSVMRRVILDEQDGGIRRADRRMAPPPEPNRPLMEVRRITALKPGETLALPDARMGRYEVYDNLPAAWSLMENLSDEPPALTDIPDDAPTAAAHLKKFRFLLRWPGMTDTEKQALYERHACHELHFYLFHKDRPFFDRVIVPLLTTRVPGDFMDDYLTGRNLDQYRSLEQEQHLNLLERILLLKTRAKPGDDPKEGPAAALLNDLCDLHRPDPEDEERRFLTALGGDATDSSSGPADTAAQTFGMDKGGPSGGAMAKSLARAPMELAEEAMAGSPRMENALDDLAEMESAPPMPSAAAAPQSKSRSRRLKKDAERRAAAPRMFRQVDQTAEYAESRYDGIRNAAPGNPRARLIGPNRFWRDLAAHEGTGPLVSKFFPEALSTGAEALMALALLDLPLEPSSSPVAETESGRLLTAAGPVIVFHTEQSPGEIVQAGESSSLMLGQQFFRADDRYREEDGETVEHYISFDFPTDLPSDDLPSDGGSRVQAKSGDPAASAGRGEFRTRLVYGCRAVLGNPSSRPLKLQWRMSIPQGALPLGKGFYQRSRAARLEPYGAAVEEFYFYFPETGDFGIQPAAAARKGQVLAAGDPVRFSAVERLTRPDTGSWAHISRDGSSGEALAYLRDHNIRRLDLDRIAFRMKDRSFFRSVMDLCRNRQFFHPTLFSYGVFHNDSEIISIYLRHTELPRQAGMRLASPLLSIDPEQDGLYEHLEYHPLINARTHPLGDHPRITNNRFQAQYRRFLDRLCWQSSLSADDRVAAAIYFLLQERIAEALDQFRRIRREDVSAKMPYDYLAAVTGLHTGPDSKSVAGLDSEEIRRIAETYGDLPSPRWRERFDSVLAVLDQAEDPDFSTSSESSSTAEQDAASAPLLEAAARDTGNGPVLDLRWRGMETVRINRYPMDIELLFSRHPFSSDGGETAFDLIRPGSREDVALPDSSGTMTLDLKPDAGGHVMVEVTGGGIRRSLPVYSGDLQMELVENFGRLRAVRNGKSGGTAGVYVKVYARYADGSVRFYKDGYTDIRGLFDYAALSTDDLDRVNRFAVLVLHPEFGADVRECDPPRR